MFVCLYLCVSVRVTDCCGLSAEPGDRVFDDSKGQSYPGGRLCVTSQCVDNTIQFYGSGRLSSSSNGIVNIQLTPTETLGLPYMLPAAIALVGVLGVIASFWLVTCPKIAACFVASCSCTVLPLLFVVVGGGLFPALIVTSDVCSSGLNVVHEYVHNAPKTVCESASLFYNPPNAAGGCALCVSCCVCVRVCLCLCVCVSLSLCRCV